MAIYMLQEGNMWEAAMTAAHYELNNLVLIIDNNHMQACGTTEQVMNVEPVPERFRAFGWQALRLNGKSIGELLEAFARANASPDRPTALICETKLCHGVPSLQAAFGQAHHFRAESHVWDAAEAELSRLYVVDRQRSDG